MTNDGPPIPGYFPSVVTEDEWHATRAGVNRREGVVGAPAKNVNVFKGLLNDARTRTPMHVLTHRRNGDGRRNESGVLYPYAYTTGKCPFTSFPLKVFEDAVLGQLREVDPRAILPRTDGATDRVLALTGKRADLEARIEKLKTVLTDGDPDGMTAVVEALRTLEGRLRDVAEELGQARRDAATPLGSAWDEAHTLIDALAKAVDKQDARTRLRAALRHVVSEIWVLVVRRGDLAVAAVQVWFTGDDLRGWHRDYLITHRPARAGAKPFLRPAETSVRSFVEAGLGKRSLDLRDSKHAAALEKELEVWTSEGRTR
jgi:hypothetical protein